MKATDHKAQERDIERKIKSSAPGSDKRKEAEGELQELKMLRGKKKMNFTRMTIKRLEDEGYKADDVEQYNGHSKRSKDLFGIFDIVAVHTKKKGTLYVQITSKANISSRQKKILGSSVTETILKAGNEIHLYGWVKIENRWDLEIREVKLRTPKKK